MTDHITLDKTVAEEIGFDINALLEQLNGVTDMRQARGIRYSLTFLLGVIILPNWPVNTNHQPLPNG